MSDDVLIAYITTIGSLLVVVAGGIFGLPWVRGQIKKRAEKREAVVPEDEREAVERYENDPGQYVKDTLAANRQYAEMVRLYGDEVRELRTELKDLREAFDARDKKDRRFRTAIIRWLTDIAIGWGRLTDMPYPRAEDREILADIIPAMVEATRPGKPPKGQTT